MKEPYQDFFEQCCEQRWKGWLAAKGAPGRSKQERALANLFMAPIDQSCLDLASKRLLTEEDLTRIDQALLESGAFQVIPQLSMWFHLKIPQPVFDVDPDDQDDPWANERVAAFFFRAPSSKAILDHTPVPPLAAHRPTQKQLAPNWYEWRLDLIDPDGTFFSAMQYYYDLRTDHWRKMETSTCPVDECSSEMNQALGYPTIVPCPACQQTMDYYSRWIATCIHMQIGVPLSLKNTAWEIRKRELFLRAGEPGSEQRHHRRFKAKIRKIRRKS